MSERTSRLAYAERVRAVLMGRPMEWIGSSVLRSVGGADAWRTRVSEVRLALEDAGLGTITNKLEKVRNDDGEVVATLSFYRFEPAAGDRCDEVGPLVPIVSHSDRAALAAAVVPERFIPPAGMPVYRDTDRPRPARQAAPDAQRSLF